MRIFETPGVYSERADANSGGVSALRTDIAGFVGIAERGPLHLAVPVESYRQFQAWFGDTIANGYLAYTARAFFEKITSEFYESLTDLREGVSCAPHTSLASGTG